MPALLTSRWRRGNRRRTSAKRASTSAATPTSAFTAKAARPMPAISSAVASAPARSTSASATSQPRPANSSAIPRPTPLAPPVTTAVLPSSARDMPITLPHSRQWGIHQRRVRGDWLHGLGPAAVGIVDLDLAAAPAANVDRARIGLASRLCLQPRGHFAHIGIEQPDVMQHAELREAREVVVKHELDVVLAVGQFHVDPGEELPV